MAMLGGDIRPASLSNLWPASDGIGVVFVNGVLYKFGGWNTSFAELSNTNNRVDMSRDFGQTWYQLPDAPFSGRHTFPVVVLDDEIYVVGGDMNSGVYQKDMWKATPLDWGLRWELVDSDCAPLSQGRAGHLAFAFEEKIVLVGGQTMDEFIHSSVNHANKVDGPYYDDMWTWDSASGWVKLFDNIGVAPACFMQGSPVKDGKMWLVGCGAYDTEGLSRVYDNRVFSGDLSGFELVTSDGGFTACMYNSVVVRGNELVTLFGWNGSNMTQIAASPNGKNFYQVPNTLMQARHAASAVTVPSGIIAFGGPLDETSVWVLS
jgi:N-acetylneuraminic acid mutarotase